MMRRLWLGLALGAAVATLVGTVAAAVTYSHSPPWYRGTRPWAA
jgi:hypothetical protein